MFKYVLFAALLAFASAKPKPLVVEYPVATAYDYAPVAAYSAYSTAPVSYAYSAYDYALPYSYAAPYTYYVR